MTFGGNIVNYVTLSPGLEADIPRYSLDDMLKALAFMRKHPAIGVGNIVAKKAALFALETWLYTKFGLPLCIADQMAGTISELPLCTHARIYRQSDPPSIEPTMNKLRFMSKYGTLTPETRSEDRYPIVFAQILN